MAVREFLATESGWRADGAFEPILNQGHTLVALLKPLTFNHAGEHWVIASNATSSATISDGGTGRLGYFSGTDDARANANETVDEWQILGFSKATGVNHPRAHRKQLGVGGWTHVDAGGSTVDDKPGDIDSFKVCSFVSARVAVVAIFDKVISDSDFEVIDTLHNSQLLADMGAIHIWEFNQASAATAVQDLAGTAHQTAISAGSIVVADDDPPGWTFGVTVIPPLEFSIRLSGGLSNTDPSASIGGEESDTAATSALFDDVSNSQRLDGLVDYRLVYVHNEDVADGSVSAYVPIQLESGRELAIGVATQAAGETVTAIANDHTAPAGVAFSAPLTAPAGVSMGTIPAGSFRGLWLRRTVASNTPQDPTNIATLRLETNRVE